MKLLLISLFWVLMNSSGNDFILRWEASNTTPLIGEPFQVTLIATYPADTQIIRWFEPSAGWGDIEVLSHDAVVTGDGFQQQTFTVVLWTVEDFQTPEIAVQYQMAGSDDIQQKSPEPLFFSVISVIGNSDDVVLRGYTPPIQPFYIPQIVYVISGIGILLVSFAGYELYKREQKVVDDDIDVPLVDDWRMKPSDELTASLRLLKSFIGEKLGYPVDNLTHDELLEQMNQHKLVSPPHLERLNQLLARYDYYHFSHEKPEADIIEQFRQYTEKWIVMAIDEMGQT
jgi:hypothetical protein